MGRVAALSGDDFESLCDAVAERKCREKIGSGTYDEAVAKYRPHPECPGCRSAETMKDGRTPAGHQRFVCKECGTRFSSLTGTIFEHSKKDLPTWANFVTCMCWNMQIEAAAELCGISHETAYEWRHRIFATVDGYQDRIMLRKRVWIDEMYVSDSSLKGDPDWKPKRGLSKNQICIAVAIDVFKNVVAVVCGHGKPSAKRIKAALHGHIEDGATIVHDMEKSHKSLVKAVKGVEEAYKANTKDPAYLEGMNLVNSLCSWIRRYLWVYVGMKPENLGSYLNWYAYLFRVKRAEEKWPKTERVIRHLMMVGARYRSSRARLYPHAG